MAMVSLTAMILPQFINWENTTAQGRFHITIQHLIRSAERCYLSMKELIKVIIIDNFSLLIYAFRYA